MALTHTRTDTPGRLVATLVFLVGIGVLFFVFILALHLFQAPVPGLPLPIPAGTQPPPAINIGSSLLLFLRQLLLLALMTLAGSLIASKGIHLYFGTHGPHSAETRVLPEKEAKTA